MADVADTHLSVVLDLAGAFRASDVAVDAIQDQVNRALNQTSQAVGAALQEARQEVSRAEAELRACSQRPGADCADLAARLTRAQERLERAQQATRLVDQASVRCVAANQRFSREMLGASRDGQRLLSSVAADIGVYLGSAYFASAAATGGAGTSTAPSGASGAQTSANVVSAASSSVRPIHGAPPDIVEVPLALINTADNDVKSREDFGNGYPRDYTPEDMKWAFNALHEVVLPALAAGKGLDYFHERDQAEGRSGTRSYTKTVWGFFDHDAIKLQRHGDGLLSIEGGHHRMWVAQQMGLRSVPARVIG